MYITGMLGLRGRRRGPTAALRALTCGWLLLAAGLASSAHANTCSPATTQGTAPSDYQAYCWLDFTGYSDAVAQSSGQPFSFALPDGTVLSLTLKVSTSGANPAIAVHTVPSWTGSAIGQSGFIGIPGNPVLYEAQSGSTVHAALTNIVVTPPPGSGNTASYAMIGADGESTNGGETLSFTTNGQSWVQIAKIPYGTAYPTVAGLGTATVTETGVGGSVGSFAFASFGNPTQISNVMVGSGLQGSMFAIRYASLSASSQLNGARANASDQFTYTVKTVGGTVLAGATTTGNGAGPFPYATVPTIASGYPLVVSEAMASGSVSTLASYAVSLTCTNYSTGSSSTVLPVNVQGSTYTFPALQYGDSISCLFTNTANRANLTIAKTGPVTVNAGATFTYNIAAANTGPADASGTLVKDPVTANFTATGATCTAATGGAQCPAAAQLTLANLQGAGIAIPTLPSGGSVTLAVQGTAGNGSGNITNVASIIAPTTLINTNTVTSSAAATTVTATADVASALVFPATVNAGQPVAGTLVFSNTGLSAANATTFSLTLPANLAVAPTLSGLPPGVTYSYNAATGLISFTGMPTTLAAGASLGPVGMSYIQPASGTSTVSATVTTTTVDSNPANNTAAATIGGVAVADLTASAMFPPTVNAGQPVTGTVQIKNNGPSPAAGPAVTLTLPANLSAPPTLTGLPAGVTYSYAPGTGLITFTGLPASLAAGASLGPIGVSYIQPASGSSTVSLGAASTTLDPNPADNNVVAVIGGAAVADVAAKVTFPATINAGQPVVGSLLITNNGPSPANGPAVTLTLPANLSAPPTLTGLPAGVTYSYAPTTGLVTFTGLPATLASGATLGPIGVSYIQPPSGNSMVSATVSTTTVDPNPANNTSAATINGVAVADLAAKAIFPASVNAGQTVTGTLQIVNNGPSPANGTNVTLTLAANLPVAPVITGLPPGATYVYTASSGIVTFTGLPSVLASGASIGPLSVSYIQPPSGNSTVSLGVASTTLDPIPTNNNVTASITGAAAQLMGTVYLDNNQDAVFDVGDTPIAGATVELFIGTRLIASTTSSATGAYTFTGQLPGSYTVAAAPLPGNLSDTPSPVAVMIGGSAVAVVNFGQIPGSAVGALVLVKTTPSVDISAGQSVPYTITATNPQPTAIVNATVTDLMPAGFRFRAGSGSVNGKRQDPTVSGRTLTWTHVSFAPGQKIVFTLVLTAGAGVVSGEFVNQATAYNGLTHTLISNLATATVRIVADPTFDCPDLIGKVFDDANGNGYEDPGEKGIAGVRLVTAQGLLVTTDAEGRYHIVCPVIPDPQLGSNFIVKVDERTLPSGFRLTTDNPETVRLTAGKVSKLNFGARLHHVVRIEVNAAAFEGNELGSAAIDRIDQMLGTMNTQAYVIRLAYQAMDESEATIKLRMQALKTLVAARFKAHELKYPLQLEEDIVRGAKSAPTGSSP
jgi:uncharacterized repeat protein (TIGR01451 family)